MAKSLNKTAIAAKLRNASDGKNCYPCQWAKLLPMSPAGQGSGPEPSSLEDRPVLLPGGAPGRRRHGGGTTA
jgi:hypothetical protein